MKTSWLFQQMIKGDDSSLWTANSLSQLSTRELRLLARILAAPKSLHRAALIARLESTWAIRNQLACFNSDGEGLAEMWVSYKGKELRSMCARAKVWRSGNKRQMSAVLLSWRDRSRQIGKAAWAEIAAEICDGQMDLQLP